MLARIEVGGRDIGIGIGIGIGHEINLITVN
jgi:hypothetical protein